MKTFLNKKIKDKTPIRAKSSNHPIVYRAFSSLLSPSVQRKAGCACGGGCPSCREEDTAIQPKLEIGQPNDKYEQEADQVAEQVMRMPEPQVQRQTEDYEAKSMQAKPLSSTITPLIQREFLDDVEGEEGILQPKQHNETSAVMQNVPSQILNLHGGGTPLPGSTRNFFESRFGADFSGVRVHSGRLASATARSINARAFTLGGDVVFGAGAYAPESVSGKKLLAHELTHVLQQTSTNRFVPDSGSKQHTKIATKRLSHAVVQRALFEGHDHGGRYEIDDQDCTFTYHQSWFFTFRTNQTDTERQAYMDAAKRQVEDVWSRKFLLTPNSETCPCHPNGISVEIVMNPHERNRQGRGFDVIVTPTESRGFTHQPRRRIDLGTAHDQPVSTGLPGGQQRIAHEFGHTIGLTDEYHGWASLFRTEGSRDRPSIMHSGDRVRPRHYQHFADLVNLELGGACVFNPAGQRRPDYENPVNRFSGIGFPFLSQNADFMIGVNFDRRISNEAILGLMYPTAGVMSVWNPRDRSVQTGPTVGLRLNKLAYPLYLNVRTGALFDPAQSETVSNLSVPFSTEIGIQGRGFQVGANYTAIIDILERGPWTHIVGVGLRVNLPWGND